MIVMRSYSVLVLNFICGVCMHKTSFFFSFYATDIDTWVNMVELNLGTNQLAIIPDNIDRLQKLEVLTLSNNLLRVSRHKD